MTTEELDHLLESVVKFERKSFHRGIICLLAAEVIAAVLVLGTAHLMGLF